MRLVVILAHLFCLLLIGTTVTSCSRGSPSACCMVVGPDGNLWFGDNRVFGEGDAKVGRITPSGKISEFYVHSGATSVNGLTVGPDGNIWFAETGKIGRITTSGDITEFSDAAFLTGSPQAITVGPDGAIWFVGNNGLLGRFTMDGKITRFASNWKTVRGSPEGITRGGDGNLWFTAGSGSIGRVTPRGKVRIFRLPNKDCVPTVIAADKNGNLWFTEAGFAQGYAQMTTTGKVSEWKTVGTGGLTRAPDGNVVVSVGSVWVDDFRWVSPAGTIVKRVRPNGRVGAGEITIGPDGNIWTTDNDLIVRTMIDGTSTDFRLPNWTLNDVLHELGWQPPQAKVR